MPDPALCFDLDPFSNPKIDVRMVEYLPPYFNPRDLPSYPLRPGRFRLTALRRADEDWSLGGKTLSFREHGRVFFVGVILPNALSTTTTRQTIESILDSLKITPHGRCRPTSGVGSTGIPVPNRRSSN